MRFGEVQRVADQQILEAAAFLRSRCTVEPQVAVVLGSGLSGIAARIKPLVTIPYEQIPGFPPVSADGHAGRLQLGHWRGLPVAVLQGRAHLYEGYTPEQLMVPIRVLHALGARYLVATNAAGGLHEAFRPGDLMVIYDHISLQWINDVGWISRLASKARPNRPIYDRDARRAALSAAARLRLRLGEGVYVGVTGPNYETRAEYRMLRRIGGDAVGMSTLCETSAAAWLDMRALAISVIANVALPDRPDRLSHDEVLASMRRAASHLGQLIEEVLCSSEWVTGA